MAKVRKSLSIGPLKSDSIEIGKGKKRKTVLSTWQAYSPSSEITRSHTFWNCWSNCKEAVMLRFLRLRVFWGISNDHEKRFAMSHPKFLLDVQTNVVLTALATTGLTTDEIERRLQQALKFIGQESNFRRSLLSQWDGAISISATTSIGPIGKHKAFSGWVRNSSAVGSKRFVNSSLPEPLSEEFTEDKFDEFEFLLSAISVGSIESNLGVIKLS
jgi:hypothetical protein